MTRSHVSKPAPGADSPHAPAPERGADSTERSEPVGRRVLAWVREFLQFGTVGGLAFVVDVGLFNLVQYSPVGFLAGHPNSANVFSASLATLFSWTVNRHWTYRGRTQDNAAKEGLLFAIGNLGGLFITQLCLLFTHHVLGMTGQLADNIAAYVVGFGLGTTFRFLFYHYVVFTGSSKNQALDAGTPAAPRPYEHEALSPSLARPGADVLDRTPRA